MPKVTLGFAVGLILLGIGTYIGAGQTSITALIPSFFGIGLGLAGLAGLRESWRKHAMHVAAVIALLGAGGALARAIPALGDSPMRIATMSQLVMGIAMIIFLVLCIRSFIAARKSGALEQG